MRAILRALIILLLGVAIFIADLLLKNFIPYPYNAINFIFPFLMLFLIFKNSGSVVWLSFVVHLLIDLYGSGVFGLVLFAGTVSILIEYWFYRDLFTNRSIWALIAMTASGLVLFRLIYSLGIALWDSALWTDTLIFYLWEILLSVFFAVIVYAIIYATTQRLRYRS